MINKIIQRIVIFLFFTKLGQKYIDHQLNILDKINTNYFTPDDTKGLFFMPRWFAWWVCELGVRDGYFEKIDKDHYKVIDKE